MSSIGTLLERLYVSIGADLSELTSALSESKREVGRMSRDLSKDFKAVGDNFKNVGQNMMKTGAVMSGAITAPLILFGKEAAAAAVESREAMAQVESALASMGPVAGRTADQLSEMAGQLQKTSTFDDDEILKKVTANLLTFGNVQGEVFDKAQQAAVDLSARLGQDLQSSAIQLGKALNDPVKGVTALQRVGVSFTESQKEMIEKMVEAGDTAGAQKLILGELEKQFAGAAQAARDAAPGSDTVDAWREFQETVGELVLNVLPPLTDILTTVLNAFNSLSPEVQTLVVGGVALAAALGPIVTVVGAVVTGFGALMPLIGAAIPIVAGLAGTVAGLAIAFWPVTLAVAAVAAAWYYWDDIVAIVEKVGKAVSNWYTEDVKPTVDAVVKIIEPLVTFFKEVFGAQIEGTIKIISALLKGDFSGAWQAAKDMVTKMVGAVVNVVGSMGTSVINAVRGMYNGVKTWIQDKLAAVFNWLKGKLEAVGGYFFDLYDKVVGHSYIPDMVDEIGQNMARLEKLMVDPAEKTTKKTKEAFRDLASDVSGILDDLFPDQAEIRSLLQDIEKIDRALAAKQITPEVAGRAKGMLNNELDAIRKAQQGPSQEVQSLMDSIFPTQATIRKLTEEMTLLDKAIAEGKGDIQSYQAARAEIEKQLGDAKRWPLADELKSLTDQLFPASAEIRQLSLDMELLNKALAAGEIDPKKYEEAMAILNAALDKSEEALRRQALMTDQFGRVVLAAEDLGNQIGDTIMSSFRDFLTGRASLGDALRDGLTKVLDNAITASLRQLEVSIFGEGGFGGFLGKALGAGIGALFGAGGSRAVGGPTLPGKAYDVGWGEKFVPGQHGRILSRSDAMRAVQGQMPQSIGRSSDVHVHINGPMSERDARRTGMQAGRAARYELAKVARVQPA